MKRPRLPVIASGLMPWRALVLGTNGCPSVGNAALPARALCPQQAVDEPTEPVCLGNDGDRDRDAAQPQQEEVTLDLLVFGVGGFQVLTAVAEGAPAGLLQPEHRVVGSSGQVVLEVGEAARE